MKKKILLAITSFALVFVVAELVLRNIYSPQTTLTEESAFEFDHNYIVKLKTNISKKFIHSKENGEGTILWKTNSNGFRGPELQSSPDLRVLVYGDSNIQGRFSQLENTFAAKLQKYLANSTGKRCEVVNCGIVGAGPDQNVIKLQQELDLYKPHLVVFHIFAENDFGDLLRNRLWEIRDNELKRTIFSVISDQRLLSQKKQSERIVFLRLLKDLVRPKDAQGLLKQMQVLCEEDFDIYTKNRSRKKCTFVDYYDIDLALNPACEAAKAKIHLMTEIIKKAYQFTSSKKIKFMIMIQPSAIDLTKNYFFSYEQLQKISPKYQQANLTNTLQDICTSLEIPYVNLYETFAKNSPNELYFVKDNHWNDNGQDLAAKEVNSFILQKMKFGDR